MEALTEAITKTLASDAERTDRGRTRLRLEPPVARKSPLARKARRARLGCDARRYRWRDRVKDEIADRGLGWLVLSVDLLVCLRPSKLFRALMPSSLKLVGLAFLARTALSALVASRSDYPHFSSTPLTVEDPCSQAEDRMTPAVVRRNQLHAGNAPLAKGKGPLLTRRLLPVGQRGFPARLRAITTRDRARQAAPVRSGPAIRLAGPELSVV